MRTLPKIIALKSGDVSNAQTNATTSVQIPNDCILVRVNWSIRFSYNNGSTGTSEAWVWLSNTTQDRSSGGLTSPDTIDQVVSGFFTSAALGTGPGQCINESRELGIKLTKNQNLVLHVTNPGTNLNASAFCIIYDI